MRRILRCEERRHHRPAASQNSRTGSDSTETWDETTFASTAIPRKLTLAWADLSSTGGGGPPIPNVLDSLAGNSGTKTGSEPSGLTNKSYTATSLVFIIRKTRFRLSFSLIIPTQADTLLA